MQFSQLVSKDLRILLRHWSFLVFGIVTVAVFALNAVYYSLDYDKRLVAARDYQNRLQRGMNLNDIYYFQPLSPYAFLTGQAGIDYPDVVRFTDNSILFQLSSFRRVSFVEPFLNLGLESIVIYLLSFFTLFIGHSAVYTERERQMLPLIFANPLSRLKWLAAKVIVVNVLLGLLLGLGLIVHLVFLLVLHRLPVDGATMLVILVFAAYSFLFSNIYLLLALLTGLLGRRLTGSLVLLILFWVCFNIVSPVAFQTLVDQSQKPFSVIDWQLNFRQVNERFAQRITTTYDNFHKALRAGQLSNQLIQRTQDQYQQLENEMNRAYNSYQERLSEEQFTQQARLHQLFLLTPVVNYNVLNSYLTGQGFFPFYDKFKKSEFIRNELIRFVRQARPHFQEKIHPMGRISSYDPVTRQPYQIVTSYDYSAAILQPQELPALPDASAWNSGIYIFAFAVLITIVLLLLLVLFIVVNKMDLRGIA